MALNAGYSSLNGSAAAREAPQWQEVEFALEANQIYDNSYADVEVSVELTHSGGKKLKRPGFWDGGKTWRVHFALPTAEGE